MVNQAFLFITSRVSRILKPLLIFDVSGGDENAKPADGINQKKKYFSMESERD